MRKFIGLVILALAGMLLVNSCDEQTTANEIDDVLQNENLFIDNSINDTDEIASNLTLEKDMELLIEEPPMQFTPPERPPRKGKFVPLGRVFREMELTEEQIDSVRKYSRMHHLCKWTIKRKFYENVKPYMDSINRERRIIIQKLRNDEITREEARALIQELNQNARAFMFAARQRIMEALKNCNLIFFERIASILNEEQLEIWQSFLEEMDERRG